MRVAVVGSGPSGVAAAKGLNSFGFNVDMLDFGNESDQRSKELKEKLDQYHLLNHPFYK